MASFVNDDTVRAIKERLSIVTVVEKYVSLVKRGASWKGLCPFHDDTNPSLHVSEDKGLFHCFSCGAGGDVFAFYMRYNNVSFPEALEALAKMAGLSPPKRRSRTAGARRLSPLYEANAVASEFYSRYLVSHSGRRYLNYLTERGVSQETIRGFSLGAAPEAWDALYSELRRRGVPPRVAEEAGLVVPRRGSEGHYDRFRNRIVFPIKNAEGRVIGFGARAMDGAEPKYLNTPETPLFKKRSSFYGLDTALPQIRRSGEVVVVEGYMDVLALWEHGVRNVVATLGTSLTHDHARLLKRYTDRVVLVFDGDEAGSRAALGALAPFLRAGISPRAVFLPEGDDPDTYVRRHGAEGFSGMVNGAVTLIDRFLDTLCTRHSSGALTLHAACREASAVAGLIESPVERGHFVRKAAEALGVRESELSALMARAGGEEPPPPQGGVRGEGVPQREMFLLKAALNYPELARWLDERGALGLVTHTVLKSVLAEVVAAGGELELGSLLARFSDEPAAQELISRAVMATDDIADCEGTRAMVDECLRHMEHAAILRELRRVRVELERAREADDAEKEYLLLKRHRELERARENLKRRVQ